MKMLFFSSERAEVESVRNELIGAGVACEIRQYEAAIDAPRKSTGDAELWIQDDADAHRAALLCVERGVGFAKRPRTDAGQDEARECSSDFTPR